MRVFLDTSAFYALLDRDDAHHRAAARAWAKLLDDDGVLITSNYVLVETLALLQNRLGMDAARTFQQDIVPVVQVVFVTEELHRSGIAALLAASRRSLSLVDCVSLEAVRSLGVEYVFAFDRHFRERGCATLP